MSTIGVIQAVQRVAADQKAPLEGKQVAVVAFAHHINRCIEGLEKVGIHAAVPGGFCLPSEYDQLSGQLWTRNLYQYVMSQASMACTQMTEELRKKAGL